MKTEGTMRASIFRIAVAIEKMGKRRKQGFFIRLGLAIKGFIMDGSSVQSF
jgi:hypothetical protein